MGMHGVQAPICQSAVPISDPNIAVAVTNRLPVITISESRESRSEGSKRTAVSELPFLPVSYVQWSDAAHENSFYKRGSLNTKEKDESGDKNSQDQMTIKTQHVRKNKKTYFSSRQT